MSVADVSRVEAAGDAGVLDEGVEEVEAEGFPEGGVEGDVEGREAEVDEAVDREPVDRGEVEVSREAPSLRTDA